MLGFTEAMGLKKNLLERSKQEMIKARIQKGNADHEFAESRNMWKVEPISCLITEGHCYREKKQR